MIRFTRLQSFSAVLALTTLLGLAVHDSRADMVVTLSVPASLAVFEGAHLLLMNSEAHTHVERVSLSETAGRFTSLDPQQRARLSDDIQYRTKSPRRGRAPFDDVLLPVRL